MDGCGCCRIHVILDAAHLLLQRGEGGAQPIVVAREELESPADDVEVIPQRMDDLRLCAPRARSSRTLRRIVDPTDDLSGVA